MALYDKETFTLGANHSWASLIEHGNFAKQPKHCLLKCTVLKQGDGLPCNALWQPEGRLCLRQCLRYSGEWPSTLSNCGR
jgi:hypothetical protein